MVTKKKFYNRIEYRNEKGQRHRLDGPAREFNSGTKQWWINGLLHRQDGPAIEINDGTGTKVWLINGLYHREDGPACEWCNGDKEWWLKGKRYSEQEWQQEIINIKLERLKNYGN